MGPLCPPLHSQGPRPGPQVSVCFCPGELCTPFHVCPGRVLPHLSCLPRSSGGRGSVPSPNKAGGLYCPLATPVQMSPNCLHVTMTPVSSWAHRWNGDAHGSSPTCRWPSLLLARGWAGQPGAHPAPSRWGGGCSTVGPQSVGPPQLHLRRLQQLRLVRAPPASSPGTLGWRRGQEGMLQPMSVHTGTPRPGCGKALYGVSDRAGGEEQS